MRAVDRSSSETNKSNDYELLIAEQPGFTVLFVGIILSLVLGLSFRAGFSESRLLREINYAASRIDTSIQFSLGGASLSLADGILPEFAVKVENIKMDSGNSCWMSPVAEINTLKLPLSFFKLLLGQVVINEIKLDEVRLTLREPRANCQASQFETQSSRDVAQNQKKSVFGRARNTIQKVSFEDLKIQIIHLDSMTFGFRNVVINSLSENPRRISIESGGVAGGMYIDGDYASRARVQLDYEEAKGGEWLLRLDGHLREGQYQITGNFNQTTDLFTLGMNFKYIPVNRLFSILKNYRVIKTDINAKKSWLSAKLDVKGKSALADDAHISLRDFQLEGDFGEISAPIIEMTGFRKPSLLPAQMRLRNVSILKVLEFLNKPHPSGIFSNLGEFNGMLDIKSNSDFTLRGEHSNLELVFSSQGKREVQRVSLLNLVMNHSANGLNFLINQARLEDGLFEGSVNISQEEKKDQYSFKMDVSELILAPHVQSVLTDGGSILPVTAKLDAILQSGKISQLNGKVKIDGINSDLFEVERAELSVISQNRTFYSDVKSKNVKVHIRHPFVQRLHLLHQDFPALKEESFLNFKGARFKFKTKGPDDFSWSQAFLSNDKWKLYSNGSWKESTGFDVRLGVLQKGIKEEEYRLIGSRQLPQIERH